MFCLFVYFIFFFVRGGGWGKRVIVYAWGIDEKETVSCSSYI